MFIKAEPHGWKSLRNEIISLGPREYRNWVFLKCDIIVSGFLAELLCLGEVHSVRTIKGIQAAENYPGFLELFRALSRDQKKQASLFFASLCLSKLSSPLGAPSTHLFYVLKLCTLCPYAKPFYMGHSFNPHRNLRGRYNLYLHSQMRH